MSVYYKNCPRCRRSMGMHSFAEGYPADAITAALLELCEECRSREESMKAAIDARMDEIVSRVVTALKHKHTGEP